MFCSGRMKEVQLPKQMKKLAKELNMPESRHPQPFFSAKGANRRLVPLASLDMISFDMAKLPSKHVADHVSKVGQLLAWLQPDIIMQHKVNMEYWSIQNWMMSQPVQSAYSSMRNAERESTVPEVALMHL